ncbi:potassium channel family protein [Radiobacillus sp. PE A8.2]|uniref:potassium channel family protein n=1 Tax=Radiobacillus sp. PE A8.2 TaxID=3380349 RepID=UPI003890F6A8
MNKQRLTFIYDIILIVLACISVAFLWSDHHVILILDKIIWFIFFIDVVVRLFIYKDKWKYVKSNPFDIIAAIPLDSIFQAARIARLFRIIRLIAIVKNRAPKLLGILRTNGLDKLVGLAIIFIFFSSVIVNYFEPNINSIADGVWWSIVTTTTVGYGDISPETPVGRIVAVILMVVGIGLIGMITGSITTFFVKDTKETNATVAFIKQQLDRYDELTPQELHQIYLLLKEMEKDKAV